jgi:hypothetical protein
MDTAAKRFAFDLSVWTLSLIAAMVLIAHEAMAGEVGPAVRNDRWQTECGSCHIPYPPQFLPASAWRRIMSSLDRHFGTDASLDATATTEIGAFLERSTGRRGSQVSGGGAPRITEMRWFLHEHDEVRAAVWRKPEVKSPANCEACHTRAGAGDFRERTLRAPN